MGRYAFCILLFVFLILPACAPDDEKNRAEASKNGSTPQVAQEAAITAPVPQAEKQENSGENAVVSPSGTSDLSPAASMTVENSARKITLLKPPTPEEIRRADKIVAFSNQARGVLGNGFYTLPDSLRDNVNKYLETWHLDPRPKAAGRQAAGKRLVPPQGIFDDAEAAQLTLSLQEMDKALAAMLGHYTELEKYIADNTIHDDGKKGAELAEKLAANHESFMKARDSWLGIVEARAAEAEQILLRDHPLQRQILSARYIFAQMREVAALFRAGEANKEILANLRQNLNRIIAEAGKPPFSASPALERLYRDFLKQAGAYSQILESGIGEGFYSGKKRELNDAAINCHKSYNEFARAANSLTELGNS